MKNKVLANFGDFSVTLNDRLINLCYADIKAFLSDKSIVSQFSKITEYQINQTLCQFGILYNAADRMQKFAYIVVGSAI